MIELKDKIHELNGITRTLTEKKKSDIALT